MKITNKSGGTTRTEKRLSQLCDKTFLGLWSYANLHTPEGMKNNKGKGKELCDLLAIIDNHLILFSDKDISFNTDIDVLVAWKRWRRKAVIKSASQLYGAEKWIRERGNEIYLDEQCAHKFPLDVPSPDKISVHLVAITSNTHVPAIHHFGNGSSGSFVLFPAMSNQDAEEAPFFVNDIDKNKTFVHVFDDVTIGKMLEELDTAYDFVNYLCFKEDAIRNNQIGVIPGEEELVAFYIEHGGLASTVSITPFLEQIPDSYRSITLVEGGWDDYLSSPFRKAMKRANEISYYWDDLVNNMASHILSATVPYPRDTSVSTHERAVRYLAGEGRIARQLLSKAFIEKLESVPVGVRSSRVCFSPMHEDRCFVLVVFPKKPGQSSQEYREQRVAAIHSYALVCKLKYPEARVITVIGTEPIGYGVRSEDVVSIEVESLTPEDLALAEEMQRDYRVLTEMQPSVFSSYAEQVRPYTDASQAAPRTSRKIGRNELCPCGSGRKYKKCCLEVA